MFLIEVQEKYATGLAPASEGRNASNYCTVLSYFMFTKAKLA